MFVFSWSKEKNSLVLFIIDHIPIRRHTHTRMLILSKRAHTPVILFLSRSFFRFVNINHVLSLSRFFSLYRKKSSLSLSIRLIKESSNLLIIKQHAESNKNNETRTLFFFLKCLYVDKTYYLFIKFQSKRKTSPSLYWNSIIYIYKKKRILPHTFGNVYFRSKDFLIDTTRTIYW